VARPIIPEPPRIKARGIVRTYRSAPNVSHRIWCSIVHMTSKIRDASEADAAACAAIYAPYVTDTSISFERVPPSAAEMAERIAAAAHTHAWLVLEDDERRVIGYAYGSPYK
jgi:hypothetical protein